MIFDLQESKMSSHDNMKWWYPKSFYMDDYFYCDNCVRSNLIDTKDLIEYHGPRKGIYCHSLKHPSSLALERWHTKLLKRPSVQGPYKLKIYPRLDLHKEKYTCKTSTLNLGFYSWSLENYMESHPLSLPLEYLAMTPDELLPDDEDIEILNFVNYKIIKIIDESLSKNSNMLRILSHKLNDMLLTYDSGVELVDTKTYHKHSLKEDIISVMKQIHDLL